MMKEPLLSVIVPVYNTAPYLERCLNSIINQTYKNLEIILVDDGSTDNSGRMCDVFTQKDSRVKVVHKENGGQNSARMAGLEKSIADYITFVDSDDFVEPEMYEVYMDFAVKYDVDVVGGGEIRDYGTHSVLEPECITPGLYRDERIITLRRNLIDAEHFFKYNISAHLIDKIYKRDLIKKWLSRVPYEIKIAEDAAVVYTLLCDAKSVYVSGKNYYHYCIRPDSIMGMKPLGKADSCYKMFDYLKDSLVELGVWQDFEKQYCLFRIYNLLLRNPYETLRYDNGFLWPLGKINRSDSVLLYGAGKFGSVLKPYLEENGFEVVAWVDNSSSRAECIKWEQARTLLFDKVIVSSLIYESTQSILQVLKNDGVPAEKIRFVRAENILKTE